MIIALVLSCAHTASGPELALCPPLEELPPRIDSVCEHFGEAQRYSSQITDAMVEGVPGWPGKAKLQLKLVYAAGPRVESMCYTELSGTYERSMIERVARRAASVVPPPELSCFAGHRFEISFESTR